MGLFTGGLFDFYGDGKTSANEAFTGFVIFNEVFGDKPDEDGDEDDDDD